MRKGICGLHVLRCLDLSRWLNFLEHNKRCRFRGAISQYVDGFRTNFIQHIPFQSDSAHVDVEHFRDSRLAEFLILEGVVGISFPSDRGSAVSSYEIRENPALSRASNFNVQ